MRSSWFLHEKYDLPCNMRTFLTRLGTITELRFCLMLCMQGTMSETRRSAFHHQWQPLLPFGADHKCGRSWRCAASVHHGLTNKPVGVIAAKLGTELAIPRPCSVWPGSVLQDHNQRWPDCSLQLCSFVKLAIRSNF